MILNSLNAQKCFCGADPLPPPYSQQKSEILTIVYEELLESKENTEFKVLNISVRNKRLKNVLLMICATLFLGFEDSSYALPLEPTRWCLMHGYEKAQRAHYSSALLLALVYA